MKVKMTEAEKLDRLRLSALGLLWGSLNSLKRETAEDAASFIGRRFGKLYAAYPGETSVEKLAHAYSVLAEIYGHEYESTVGKDKSFHEVKRCATKLDDMPKIVQLVGEPVLGSMCEFCKTIFPMTASANDCSLDIGLTENGCKFTITSK
jgi:hypothetical protein